MASKNFDDSDGVWRTIGGRRVFIRKGQSLSDAMKESGKFKKKEEKDIEKTPGQKTADLIKENNIKTFADEIKEKDEKESISHLYDVKETEDGYEGKGKDLLKFIENEEQDSGVEISDALKDKLRKNPDDTFVFDNENETIVAKTNNNSNKKDAISERDAKDLLKQLNDEGSDFSFDEDITIEDGKLKTNVGVFMPDERGYVNRDLEIPIDDNETYDSLEEKLRDWQYRHNTPDAFEDEDFPKSNKQADLLKDKELQKAVGEDLKKSFENVKDGKYYRNRLQELDSADTPTGTYDIETGEVANFNGKGYNVSFEQTGVQLSDDEYLAKINECRDRCDGKVYFGKYGGTPEVSFYTEDINEAMKIMKENNQYSIYDIANDTEIVNDEYNEATNKIKDLSQTKATNDNLDLTKADDDRYEFQKSFADRINKGEDEDKVLKEASQYGMNAVDVKTMSDRIREKASKKSTFKDNLPKHTEIKTQGTSNRKEVSENIQAHILDYYDSPQDFIEQMDAMSYLPTKWKQGEELAKGGSYLIYNDDMSDFLNELKINPKGKSFSDDKAFDMYTSLIGRESAKLYDRLMKNEYNKYRQSHPLTKMTLEEFIKSRKEK